MSNTFSNLSPIILAGALAVLREEAVLASRVSKDFNGAQAQLGDTVRVMVPASQAVTDVTPAATPPALADKTITSKLVTIDQWKATRFHLTEIEALKIKAGDYVPGQIGEAARALAYTLNAAIFANYKGVYGYAGTAATNPFTTNVNPVVDLRGVLNFQRCPEGARTLAVGHAEEAAALKLTDLHYMLYAGDNNALRRGIMGNLFGLDTVRDVQRPVHTAGSPGGTPVVDGIHAVGVAAVVVKSGGAAGTYKQGDVVLFNVSGTDGPNGGPQTYVVGADVTLSGGGAGTLAIDPPLVTALGDGDTITLKATRKVNLAFDPGAIALVMRVPGNTIEGAPTYGEHMTMSDPVTGMALKLSYLPGYHAANWELSMLYGTALIDPRRAAVLAG